MLRFKVVVPAMTVGILLAACDAGSADTQRSPLPLMPSDLVAVTLKVFPFIADEDHRGYTVCGLSGDLSPCPLTDRLKQRLTQAKITLCPCQNPASSLDVTATPTQTGGVAHVLLGFGARQIRLDLVIVQSGGQLLVDDEICTGGGPSTSIYVRTGGC
jgi:hypothetical protein